SLGDGDFQVSCPILLRLARHSGAFRFSTFTHTLSGLIDRASQALYRKKRPVNEKIGSDNGRLSEVIGVPHSCRTQFTQCPLYPQKRKLEPGRELSALCQKQTHPPQQLIVRSSAVPRDEVVIYRPKLATHFCFFKGNVSSEQAQTLATRRHVRVAQT